MAVIMTYGIRAVDSMIECSKSTINRMRNLIVFICGFVVAPFMLLFLGSLTSAYLYLYKWWNKDKESFNISYSIELIFLNILIFS